MNNPKQLREYREAKHLTLEQMGKLLGFHGKYLRQHMSNIEHGRREMSADKWRIFEAIKAGYVPTKADGDD